MCFQCKENGGGGIVTTAVIDLDTKRILATAGFEGTARERAISNLLILPSRPGRDAAAIESAPYVELDKPTPTSGICLAPVTLRLAHGDDLAQASMIWRAVGLRRERFLDIDAADGMGVRL